MAGIVDARLPEILATQKTQTWSRSRNPGTAALYDRVRELKNAGHTQLQMCERLDAQKWPLPDLVAWRDLTWRAAFLSPKYNGAVKKWLSKITSVTSQTLSESPQPAQFTGHRLLPRVTLRFHSC